LRDLKSGNVGQLNITHYEIGFAGDFQHFDAAARQRFIAMRFLNIVEQLLFNSLSSTIRMHFCIAKTRLRAADAKGRL
jgi:hypothetical protein